MTLQHANCDVLEKRRIHANSNTRERPKPPLGSVDRIDQLTHKRKEAPDALGVVHVAGRFLNRGI
jgi:hypothetical protein